MNPVLGIIGNMLGGGGSLGAAGNAQASGTNGANFALGLLGMLSGSSNSMQMLQQMAPTNPQIQQVFDYVQQSGGTMKDAFYKLAEQRGVNPSQVINMINKM